jgi:hypothetical protein
MAPPGSTEARRRTAKALQKPPGHAVHGRQHHGVGAEQGADLLRHGGQRGRFDRNDHQVLHAQGCSVVGRGHRHGVQLATLVQLQAVLLQGGERVAARQHAQLRTGILVEACDVRAHPTANSTCTHDGDFFVLNLAHARHPLSLRSI